MGFADSVKLSVQRVEAQINKRAADIAEEMFRKVIDYSPVNMLPQAEKRGELKNNWWLGEGIGQYNRTHSSAFDADGTSSYTQASMLKNTTQFLGKDGEVSFTNSVPYVLLAEEVGWLPPQWKGTPPYKMVFKALAETAGKYK